jgi:hypothetical protein
MWTFDDMWALLVPVGTLADWLRVPDWDTESKNDNI